MSPRSKEARRRRQKRYRNNRRLRKQRERLLDPLGTVLAWTPAPVGDLALEAELEQEILKVADDSTGDN